MSNSQVSQYSPDLSAHVGQEVCYLRLPQVLVSAKEAAASPQDSVVEFHETPASWAAAEKSGSWCVSLEEPSIPVLINQVAPEIDDVHTMIDKLARAAAHSRPKHRKGMLHSLLEAKRESDRKNFKAKHDIMRKLIAMKPVEFTVDDNSHKELVGITHQPTGFRMHLPKSVLPTSMLRKK